MNAIIPGILVSLAPVLILLGIIAVAITASRGNDSLDDEPGIGTVRRLLGYGSALAGLALLTAGATLLLRTVVEAATGDELVRSQTNLALGLALTIVGAPVWIASWLVMERVVRSHPVELRTLGRKAYLHLVLAGSGLALVFSSINFFSTLGRDGPFDETSLAVAILTAAVWAYHWRIQEREGQLNAVTMTAHRIYVYGMSLVGVVLKVVGVGSVLTILMSAAYDSIFGSGDLLSGSGSLWSQPMQAAVAQVFIGAAVAWWHWIRAARGDQGSWMRSVYLYPIAILGGAIAVVAASSVGLYHVLQWWFGQPSTSSARIHFDVFPGLIATVLVGAGLWVYHWQVARQEAAADEQSARAANRIYHYLVAALGLATLSVGLVMVFELFIGLISPSGQPSLRGDLWRNPLALTITLLTVGTPAWLAAWWTVQSAAAERGVEERDALSRRIFIYGTFGVAMAASLVTLSIILFFVFEAILGDRPGGRLLWDSRWSIAILLTAGVATAYFWQVLREDRAVVGAATAAAHLVVRKRVTIMLMGPAGDLVDRIESALGYDVAVWRSPEVDTGGADVAQAELDAAVQQVRDAELDEIMLLAESGRLRVVPYSR